HRDGLVVFEADLGAGKRHPVLLEGAVLEDLAVAHRHDRVDALAEVALPDPYARLAFPGRHQPLADGEGTHRRREVPAVAAVVDQGLLDRHRAERVVHVAVVSMRRRDQHDLARAGGGAPHAVGVPAIRIRAADDPQQQGIALRARPWQVALVEEHAFAGPAPHVHRRDAPLLHLSSLPMLRSIFVHIPRSRSTSSTLRRVREKSRRSRGISFFGCSGSRKPMRTRARSKWAYIASTCAPVAGSPSGVPGARRGALSHCPPSGARASLMTKAITWTACARFSDR